MDTLVKLKAEPPKAEPQRKKGNKIMIDYRNINDDQYEALLKEKENCERNKTELINKYDDIISYCDTLVENLKQNVFKLDVGKGLFRRICRLFLTESTKKAYRDKRVLVLKQFVDEAVGVLRIESNKREEELDELSRRGDAIDYMIEEYELHNKLVEKDKMCKALLEEINENIDKEDAGL